MRAYLLIYSPKFQTIDEQIHGDSSDFFRSFFEGEGPGVKQRNIREIAPTLAPEPQCPLAYTTRYVSMETSGMSRISQLSQMS